MEGQKIRKQRISKEMETLINQLDCEGGTRQEKLKRSGLAEHIFNYWYKKFGELPKQQSSFVEVKRSKIEASSFIRITKGNGIELEIKEYVSASYVKELLGW
jgi:hypothetical protein